MRRRKSFVAAAAAVVLVAVGGVAYAQTGSSGSYRTATATTGDVDQVLALSGTITASARRDLSFGAAGTVAKVKVAAGDRVRSGATLATLDPTDLDAAVTAAKATVAKARAQLESDQTSQASTVTSAASGTSSASGSSQKTPSTKTPSTQTDTKSDSKGSGSSMSPALTKALAQLKQQQAAVTTAQTAATEAIRASKQALTVQVSACEVEDEPAEPSDEVEADESPEPAALAPECTAALDDVQAAQDVVAGKQDVLQDALQTLSTTLSAAVKTLGASTDTGSPASPEPSATPETSSAPAASPAETSAGTGDAPAASSSSRGATVTAAGLAKDQAAIDTATAQLEEAKQAQKAAELTAPFSGEILSVSAVKGDVVGASDVVIVIAGDGSTTVSTTATLEQVPDIAKGQVARVTPAGASEPVTGEVTAIGLLPVSSSDTSTYPVTIVLDDDVVAPEGSTASIALVTGTAKDVVTVPSSAVSAAGRTTVSVLVDDEVVRTPVTIGVVGTTRTEITDGIKAGQVVVLADLGVALPSGDGSTTRLPGARGGFGGGAPGGGDRPTGGRG